jgi:MinD superfamily P-loop ATPase
MIITIASGKGGTGKTTIAVNLACSAGQPIMLLDCDVEEPNAHLFLKPDITATMQVYKPIPQVDETKCTYCGTCAAVCAYHAIAVVSSVVLVFDKLCHGCGGCMRLCPEGAISEVGQAIGIVERGRSGQIDFVHGKLTVGEAMAGPVIRAVKHQINGQPFVIIDVPPGTACPVVATLIGSDFCLLVTEPTPFGLYDLKLAVTVARQLGIPCGVVINRADIGDQGVETYCAAEQIPILMRIPNDRRIAEAYSRGGMLVEALPEYRPQFQALLEKVTT